MFSSTALLAVVLCAAPARPFGPVGTARHPVVGPVAAVPGNGPEPVPSPAPEEVRLEDARKAGAGQLRSRGSSNPLYLLFLVYKNALTKVDGSRCAHYPTCSAYGVQAVGRHNVLGVFMTMDRLWAGDKSSAVRPYRLVNGVGPTPRFYDPIEDSSFWFAFPWQAFVGMPVSVVDEARGRNKEDPESAAQDPHAH